MAIKSKKAAAKRDPKHTAARKVTAPKGAFFDRELETLSRGKLGQLQDRRLKKLLTEVLKSNPFYRNKFHAAGINKPVPLSRFSDIPFTKKSELVLDQESNPPFGKKLTYPLERYTRLHQTSGTTGAPIRFPDSPDGWASYVNQWCMVYRGAGVVPGDRIYVAFSFGPFIGFWGAFDGAHAMGCMAMTGGGQTTEQRILAMRDLRPTVLVCTPTYALRLAEEAQRMGIDTRGLGIRITVHAGEPGAGIPATRRRLQELWNAKAYDHVGMTEVGAYGFECQKQLGPHANESDYIVECIDPATGKAVPDGKRGEVVLTTLGRIGTPLIRYRTGDLAEITRKRCACGRTFALLKGGILGRADDMITVRGINVFPSAIENILRRFPEIVEFQGEVVVEREMHELLLRLETSCESEQERQTFAQRVVAEMRSSLNLRPMIHFAPAGTLPRSEMKSRRFKTPPR